MNLNFSSLIDGLIRTMPEVYKNPDGNLFSHQDFFEEIHI